MEIKGLIKDIYKYGDLLFISNKGMGKSNALKCLARELRKDKDVKVIIFEDIPQYCLEFDEIPYLLINDYDVVETKKKLEINDNFISHVKDYTVLRGEEISSFLQNNKDCLFTMNVNDIERTAFFIYSIVQHFYHRAYLNKFHNRSNKRIVFIIEESQNVFDSTVIAKKIFNRLKKMFSVGRNLNLHFILCSQRLQDLNTRIRCRTRLLVGQVSLDDYELKLNRLLRHSEYREKILSFPIGTFLYTPKDKIIKFAKFEASGKPYKYKLPFSTRVITNIEEIKVIEEKRK